MHVDPLIPPLVGVILAVLVIGLLLQFLRQPQLVGYIITGVAIGPSGFALLTDQALIEHLGAIGVTLLLFFIGMEISPKQLALGWRIALGGTLFQIGASVALTWSIGLWLGWELPRVILLGFVISLSSTAVVLKLLKDRGELNSRAGENVLLILLAQDLAVVPMLIVISLFSSEQPGSDQILKQLAGAVIVLGLAAFALSREHFRLPFASRIKQDHELQVFAALLICFGLAFVTGTLGLSSALGAFVAGMIVASARETDWVHHALEPLRVVFVALLFVSIGMLIEIGFVLDNWLQVGSLVIAVLLTNTFINAGILRALGNPWPVSLYSGALLAQIGEFSFVLVSVGLQAAIVSKFGYQLTIAVIALTLALSPAWIGATKRLLGHRLSPLG